MQSVYFELPNFLLASGLKSVSPFALSPVSRRVRQIIMKPREVTTWNGQSPVGPLVAPSARFLDAVNGGTEADLFFSFFFL